MKTVTLFHFILAIILSLFGANESKTWLPPPNNGALMARYIVHSSDYTSIATISSQKAIAKFPFVSITSISDGAPGNSTGNIYMYLPEIDFSAIDLESDSRCSLMISLIQGDYCKQHKLDAQDPRCAHVMMTGTIIKLPKGTEEFKFAQKTLFERHPIMASWPTDHHFFVVKMVFQQIAVQDMFGGPLIVTPEDYFNISPNNLLVFQHKLYKKFGYQVLNYN